MKIYIIFKCNNIYEIYKKRNKKKALKEVNKLNDEYNMMNNYYITDYERIYELKEYKIK